MTSFSSDDISRRMIHHRAVEAVIWGTPAVNFDRMFQAMVHDAKAGEGSNRIVYWSHLFNWKNQTLTPNPDSIYFMPFFNTKDVGPVVIEVPPADGGSITGSIDDCWQTAIADVGPAGTDQGKGGKYLLLPPGYKEAGLGDVSIQLGKSEIISRLDGKRQWSLKVDKIDLHHQGFALDPDQFTSASFDNIHEGVFYRDGKPEATFSARTASFDNPTPARTSTARFLVMKYTRPPTA